MNEQVIEQIVRDVLRQIRAGGSKTTTLADKPGSEASPQAEKKDLDPQRDYPLAQKRPELLRTATGKKLEEVTFEAVMAGQVDPLDVRITSETLLMQAEIAEGVGRTQLANNLRRAAELVRVPDERILEMYNALRPNRSTKAELLAIADELEKEYEAKINAAFVREAAEVYERRGLLRTG